VNNDNATRPDLFRQGTPAEASRAGFTKAELARARRLVRKFPKIRTTNPVVVAAALAEGYTARPCDGRLSNAWIEIADQAWAPRPGHVIETLSLACIATVGNA
jgi:hypothetical protein